MKKVLMAIIMVCLFSVPAYSVIIDVTDGACTKVTNSQEEIYECKYTLATVAAGVTQEYSLNIGQSSGYIKKYNISDNSTDFDYWFATGAGMGIDDNSTFISNTAQNLKSISNFCLTQDFVVDDNTTKKLWFTFKNDGPLESLPIYLKYMIGQ